MRAFQVYFLFVFLYFLVGCVRSPAKVQELVPTSANPSQLQLFVSNQSFADSLIDVDVFVDGIHVITGDFEVENQHSWHSFDFQIDPGNHTLKATAHDGEVVFEQNFVIEEAYMWGVLDYWHYPEPEGGAPETPRSFSWYLLNQPPTFE